MESKAKMKFTVVGNRIICSCKDNKVVGEDAYKSVVEFDAHVDSVPPHVCAKLIPGQVEQLKEFMADRKRIQSNPAVKNMIEALPGLLKEATDVLSSVETVNEITYNKLSVAIEQVCLALDKVKPVSRGEPTPVDRMHFSEVQKERLENIKQEL